MGKPWASLPSLVQAPVQSLCRPAVWLPGVRNFHSHKETWTLASDSNVENLQAVLRGLGEVIKRDRSRSFWDVHTVNSSFLRIFVFTRMEWLDVIEITFKKRQIVVWSFSSGFLPLFIPFAPIINMGLFWVPFLDMGLNKKRIDRLVAAMDVQVDRH